MDLTYQLLPYCVKYSYLHISYSEEAVVVHRCDVHGRSVAVVITVTGNTLFVGFVVTAYPIVS